MVAGGMNETEQSDSEPTDGEPTHDAFLGGSLMVSQPSRGYRAGLDAVLLAAAVPARQPDQPLTVLDLGAGVGTVGLCIAARLAMAQVTLLETQPELVQLAACNIARNGLAARIRVIAANVHDSAERLQSQGLLPDAFDHVVCNPPFDVEGHGRAPPNALKARSHAMPAGELEQWARVLARYCRPSGMVTMIHRADALGVVLAALSARFGDLRVLPLHPRVGEPATRVIVQGIKGSRAPLVLRAGLVLHKPDGHGFVDVLQAVLRDGAGLP
jgi:tRNA1(Val) A37 N6-methylase TrmN6